MKKMNKKGFTIVELVIVIAVIAILAAVMIPTFSGIITKAQESAALQEAAAAAKTVQLDILADGVVDSATEASVTTEDGYTFTFDTTGTLLTASGTGFTYTVEDGVITKATKG